MIGNKRDIIALALSRAIFVNGHKLIVVPRLQRFVGDLASSATRRYDTVQDAQNTLKLQTLVQQKSYTDGQLRCGRTSRTTDSEALNKKSNPKPLQPT